MIRIVEDLLLVAGLAFNLLGCLGLVRLPDVYNRLQAATKCVTLGTCLILLSVMVGTLGSGSVSGAVKAMLCMVFILITSPTAAHALARGAHVAGIRLCQGSVVDRFAEDREPGRESDGERCEEETP